MASLTCFGCWQISHSKRNALRFVCVVGARSLFVLLRTRDCNDAAAQWFSFIPVSSVLNSVNSAAVVHSTCPPPPAAQRIAPFWSFAVTWSKFYTYVHMKIFLGHLPSLATLLERIASISQYVDENGMSRQMYHACVGNRTGRWGGGIPQSIRIW